MPKRLVRLFREHTGAGKYLAEVEYGSAMQQDKARDLSDPDLRERLSRVFESNHASLRIAELFQGRR